MDEGSSNLLLNPKLGSHPSSVKGLAAFGGKKNLQIKTTDEGEKESGEESKKDIGGESKDAKVPRKATLKSKEHQDVINKYYKNPTIITAKRKSVMLEYAKKEKNRNPKNYSEKSLRVFSLDNPFRRILIKIIENKWFDRLILTVISLNSLSYAIQDNTVIDIVGGNPASKGFLLRNLSTPATSAINLAVEQANYFFTAVFMFECFSKVIGMGFYSGKGSYLRDSWNILDIFVVLTSIIDLAGSGLNVSILRTARVLRPLKSLNSLPKLRDLVKSLFASLPPLANVVIVLLFLCVIFGIFGVQLWSGKMNYRCRLVSQPIQLPPELVQQYRIAQFAFNTNNSDTENVDWYINFLTNRTAFPWCGYQPTDEKWTQDTSPWGTSRNCAWPVDNGQGTIFSSSGDVNITGYDTDSYGNSKRKSVLNLVFELTFIVFYLCRRLWYL